MRTFIRTCLILALALPFSTKARAECPESAVQALFNAKMGVQTGQISDINQVFGLANEALQKCSDNDAAQVIAAELFAMVGNAVKEDTDKFTVFSQAFDALQNSEAAYDNNAPVPDIVIGTETQPLYTFGSGNAALSFVVSQLAHLGLKSQFHEIFTKAYQPGMACPHIYVSRAEAEAEGFLDWTREWRGQLTAGPNMLYRGMALKRLEGIWTTCDAFQTSTTLSYAIAMFNLELAQLRKEEEPAEALANARKAQSFGAENMKYANDAGIKYIWPSPSDKAANDLIVELGGN